ncbi:TniB family NTP-binding protein [Acaryochloris sp. CCMEE 5410]|uniref:TniB family NTP-binding protein n=1 Tax=Acaryochloris sp. CCMEE 5410 TaxID=310037 RepID=UPI0021CF7B3E|nr:TniB family NTP-binding protein [Acaryochloris sp. CCMEE 5410]KAI9129909.1 TniB family NTP-binding protein [Acaryochloris sp. CCMEE 5410]
MAFYRSVATPPISGNRGRIPELRERLYNVLSNCGVEMLILDEAQRLTERAISEARDISDKLEISVVLVGTDRLNAVLSWDEQVKYRFLLTYHMPRLNSEELRETTALWKSISCNYLNPQNSPVLKLKICSFRKPKDI